MLVAGFPDIAPAISDEDIDTFVKNAHHIRVLRGCRWGEWDTDKEALGAPCLSCAPHPTR